MDLVNPIASQAFDHHDRSRGLLWLCHRTPTALSNPHLGMTNKHVLLRTTRHGKSKNMSIERAWPLQTRHGKHFLFNGLDLRIEGVVARNPEAPPALLVQYHRFIFSCTSQHHFQESNLFFHSAFGTLVPRLTFPFAYRPRSRAETLVLVQAALCTEIAARHACGCHAGLHPWDNLWPMCLTRPSPSYSNLVPPHRPRSRNLDPRPSVWSWPSFLHPVA
ncbi:hypothetical protein BDZ85DRAFT_105787 [Elsinoe ampelina]|uniref:Uncharacterized protein n=1 Tax=Elsinoe ampelina TaxID=302913 RepID=A0A6A6FY63_9PEZI|nr:hypothetical protein BDZ85DRAFT_105787 [Elsinoe ampelina]